MKEYAQIRNTMLFTIMAMAVMGNLSLAKAVTLTTARTTGVAPLNVIFQDADATSAASSGTFHTYHYAWDFGDPASGTWGTSGRSKNADTGPIAAHVFESAGTYTVTLTVRNASGTIATDNITISVADADTTYSLANTTCVNNVGDNAWTACPTGAHRVNTNDITSLTNYADAGERILLKRSGSWTVSSDIDWPNNSGPVHIGAYGTCQNPDDLKICSNAPQVTLANGVTFLDVSYKNNWRLADISFSGAKADDGGRIIFGATNIKHHLMLRLNSTGLRSPLPYSHWRRNDAEYIENNAVVSCRATDFYATGIYVGGERIAVMGNIVQNSDRGHICRVWQGYWSVISHNIFSGASLYNQTGLHALKLHGPSTPDGPLDDAKMGTFAETGESGLRNYTRFCVVANNVFGNSGPWTVGIGPQSHRYDEPLNDILFENNRVLADYGPDNQRLVTVAASFWGRYMTIRNNLFDGSGSATGDYIGINVARRGIEWAPQGNRVYNNTIYSRTNLTANSGTGIHMGADATDTIVRNNYLSFPNSAGGDVIVQDNSGTAQIGHNALTNSPNLIDPDNADPLSRNYGLLDTATEAIDQGYDLRSAGVLEDFEGYARSTPLDIGADEYGNTGDDPDPLPVPNGSTNGSGGACFIFVIGGHPWFVQN